MFERPRTRRVKTSRPTSRLPVHASRQGQSCLKFSLVLFYKHRWAPACPAYAVQGSTWRARTGLRSRQTSDGAVAFSEPQPLDASAPAGVGCFCTRQPRPSRRMPKGFGGRIRPGPSLQVRNGPPNTTKKNPAEPKLLIDAIAVWLRFII